MDPKDLSSVGRKHLHLIELDENEQIVYEIRKHHFGLVGVYAIGFLVTIALAVAVIGLLYLFDGDQVGIGSDLSFLRPIVGLLGIIFTVASLIMTGVAAYLYESNVVYVTTDKLAQVLYKTIFNRKISQLSIGDIQDVTTNQKGLFAHLFNYGTLVVETAGEQSNYTFTYTPHPYEATRAIVNAHEENLKKYGN